MIRKAKISDARILADFALAMAAETEGKMLDSQTVLRGVEEVISNPERGFYLVAEKAGRVIAACMITYEFSDWRNGLFWWLQSVYVLPEFRKQAVLRDLLEYVEELADKHSNICGLRLYVEKNNESAQAAYKKLGMNESTYRIYEKQINKQAF